MQKQYKLTKERLEELKLEMEHLKTVKEREVAEQIKVARGFGDLSENSEYDEAKNEQGKLYSRIAELEVILANAVVIEENDNIEKVGIGSRVKILNLSNNSEGEYTIVGTQEANPGLKRVSDESPFGKGLLNHAVGEIVKIEAPARTFECKILEIMK